MKISKEMQTLNIYADKTGILFQYVLNVYLQIFTFNPMYVIILTALRYEKKGCLRYQSRTFRFPFELLQRLQAGMILKEMSGPP